MQYTLSYRQPFRRLKTQMIHFRCGKDDYNVVFYVNEEALIPICKDGVCTWQEFENKLKPFSTANTDFC